MNAIAFRIISAYRKERYGDGNMTPVTRLIAGGCAGIVAMTGRASLIARSMMKPTRVVLAATYPLDMVRGRLTVQEGAGVEYKGIWHASLEIYRQV